MHLLDMYAFFESENMGEGSHCAYKNIGFLFKFETLLTLDGSSSERFLEIEGRLVCLFVLGIRQFPVFILINFMSTVNKKIN